MYTYSIPQERRKSKIAHIVNTSRKWGCFCCQSWRWNSEIAAIIVAENIQDWNLETAVAYFGQNKMNQWEIKTWYFQVFKSNFHHTSFKCRFKFHGMACWLWIESVPCKPLAEVVRWGLDLSPCHTSNQVWHWTVNFRKIELVYNFILITRADVLFENRKALLVLWSCGWGLIEPVSQSSKPILTTDNLTGLPTA